MRSCSKGGAMDKMDFKKEFKELYFPSVREVSLVDVPEMNFAMIDGEGDPNTSQDFQGAMQAIYAISYTAKFILKKEQVGPDYVVPPAEGLWWADDMAAFSAEDKGAWKWTLMIMQPKYVTKDVFSRVVAELEEKKDLPALAKARFESFKEGLSAQIMHIGPYAAEAPTIAKLHAFIEENGYAFNGKHHEIYMGDPRRTKPEKLKTVIRQPVKAKRG